MKNFVLITLLTLSLMNPPLCSAYYVIQLKNGRKFSTNYYWKHNDKTMFYIAGGVLGVADGIVDRIHEVAYIYKNMYPDTSKASDEEEESARKETPIDESTESESKDVHQAKDSPRDTNKHTDTPSTLEEYKKKKVELKTTLDKSLEKFRQASSNKDQAAKKKAMDEMTAISKQMFALDDEVKKKHDGVLPDWWEKL